MFQVLRHSVYGRLFLAQVLALLGTGLMTVALALLAYDLAGEHAGAVLGTAFAIKMIAYVGLAPVVHALVGSLPRKLVLIVADLVRASVALALPFIDAIWQIYVLIFVLQAASATFTPAFQAIIPDVLKDEQDYTKALSLSRLAYDLENLISPALAGLLLVIMSYSWLFGGTVLGFVASALLVFSVQIPRAGQGMDTARSFVERLTRGARIYLATPRLRGLLALNLAASASGAFVLVNTVVMAKLVYGASEVQVTHALMAFGGGSMAAALVLPKLLEKVSDRTIMTRAALLLTCLTMGHAVCLLSGEMVPWAGFLGLWAATGMFYSAVLTPSGRLLRVSAHLEDRPSVFTAQFALSHAAWLITYPIAGWAGEVWGFGAAMAVLGGIALTATSLALLLWPSRDQVELEHDHSDLPPDHPHLQEHGGNGTRHRHVFVIDDEHRVWPTYG